jgi:hypothetical protein
MILWWNSGGDVKEADDEPFASGIKLTQWTTLLQVNAVAVVIVRPKYLGIN